MLLHSPYPLSPWPPWHHVESSSGVCQPQPQPRPVSSAASTASCRKAQLQLPSFTFYDVHGVSEWQTTPGRWPWQTAAAALVPAGHTKVCSSQLVSLSLWLNAWCSLHPLATWVLWYSTPNLITSDDYKPHLLLIPNVHLPSPHAISSTSSQAQIWTSLSQRNKPSITFTMVSFSKSLEQI